MVLPESSLGALVAQQPALAGVFERLEIVYCGGGKQSLAAACQALFPRAIEREARFTRGGV